VLRLLLSKAAVDVVEKNGGTPLHRALFEGRHECAGLLLDHGARVNVQANDGGDALAYALSFGRRAMIERMMPLHPDTDAAETAARRHLADVEDGVLATVDFDALGLSEDACAPLKQKIRDAAASSFDAFCTVLEAAVRDLGGDPRYEVARLQALTIHEPDVAKAMADAAVGKGALSEGSN
jgi:hypothetical protein